ncbi:helix-turn-helix domain-containing protein [Spirillospora sp. NPDC047279]|uniref:PucR family transcriptional regulator n=1 Tax=Spirillospora sp. NPDC047279 TaxID=3155478 RepID=UPI0033C19890
MTQTLEPGALDDPSLPVPRGLASLMRPELPSLTEEIITEIRRNIPEYARPLEGPYGQALRTTVERHLAAFVDQIADPAGVRAAHEEACRRLGQLEAHEGRSLDCLQAAFRISGQVAWRRIMKAAPRFDVSAAVMSGLADTVFAYMDRLAALALDGYVQAKQSPVAIVDERRRRLLRLILEGPSAAKAAIRDLAESAGWKVPDEVVLVATQPSARYVRATLDGDVLVDFESSSPHLLLPGPLTPGRLAMLKAALPDHRAAVGLTVPIARAADSLRWARQTLALARRGVLDDGPLTLCEDHLVTLWLLSDIPLIEQLAKRQLAVMNDLTPAQYERLVETLRVWLVTRGTAAEMADKLHVHPQTVRYRMRQLERTLGDRLQDPETRFGIEVVLRAMHLRQRATGA